MELINGCCILTEETDFKQIELNLFLANLR
jgi:hypothetical protein